MLIQGYSCCSRTWRIYIWIVMWMFLDWCTLCQSASSVVYRTKLNSSSIKKMSISANASIIALADTNKSQIIILNKTNNQQYSQRILNESSIFLKTKYYSSIGQVKIHLNNKGTNLYYVNQNDQLVMVNLSQWQVSEKIVHNQLRDQNQFGWGAVGDYIGVMFQNTNQGTDQVYLYNGLNRTYKFADNFLQSNFRESTLFLKSLFLFVNPSLNLVKVYKIDPTFTGIQSVQFFRWTRIDYQTFYKKKEIWRISCHDSLYAYNSEQYCYNRGQNLVRTKVNYELKPSIAQNLKQQSEIFTSKNNEYFVILTRFQDKTVLKMYNLQEVTNVGSLQGVLVQLQLTDLCYIRTLQINQNGDKLVYICTKYLGETELVVFEHTLGVHDVYDATMKKVHEGLEFALYVGFCFSTFLFFLVLICLICLFLEYRKVVNKNNVSVQIQRKPTNSNSKTKQQRQNTQTQLQNFQTTNSPKNIDSIVQNNSIILSKNKSEVDKSKGMLKDTHIQQIQVE